MSPWERLADVARGLAGGADARHHLRARLLAKVRRHALRRRREALRRARPGAPLVAIGLLDNFGDIVAAEPIVRELRREHPDGHLVFVVGRRNRELVASHPALDEVVTVDCLTEWISLSSSPAVDRVVNLHFQWASCPRCQVPHVRADGGNGVTFDNFYDLGNLLEVFCRLGGVRPLSEGPRLHLPPGVEAGVDELALPPRYVAIHCTPSDPARGWTAERWHELVARLLDAGAPVAEVGLTPTVRMRRPGYVDLCGRLSLAQTAEVIRRAAVFVGIDSGPAHLANAMGTYGVIVLGVLGSFERHMPYSGDFASGRNATLLRAPGPAATTEVATVLDAVLGALHRARGAAT